VVSEVLKSLKITPINVKKADGSADTVPVLNYDESSFQRVRVASLCLINLSAMRGGLKNTDPAIAGNSTYAMEVDIPMDMLPGSYSIDYELKTAAELAGYSPVPTTFDVKFAFFPVIEGAHFTENTHYDGTYVYSTTNVRSKTDVTGKAVLVYVATATATVQGYISAWTFGQLTPGSIARGRLCSEAALRTGEGTNFVLYQDGQNGASLNIKTSTAITASIVVMW